MRQRIERLLEKNGKLDNANDCLENDLQVLRNEKENLEEAYEELKGEHEEFREEFYKMKEKRRKMQKENKELKIQVAELQIENPECEELKGEIAALEIKNEDLDNKFTKLLDKNKRMVIEAEAQSQKIMKLEAAKKQFKEIEAQLKNLLTSRDDSFTQKPTGQNENQPGPGNTDETLEPPAPANASTPKVSTSRAASSINSKQGWGPKYIHFLYLKIILV